MVALEYNNMLDSGSTLNKVLNYLLTFYQAENEIVTTHVGGAQADIDSMITVKDKTGQNISLSFLIDECRGFQNDEPAGKRIPSQGHGGQPQRGDFVFQPLDIIYTRRQLMNLLKRIMVGNVNKDIIILEITVFAHATSEVTIQFLTYSLRSKRYYLYYEEASREV